MEHRKGFACLIRVVEIGTVQAGRIVHPERALLGISFGRGNPFADDVLDQVGRAVDDQGAAAAIAIALARRIRNPALCQLDDQVSPTGPVRPDPAQGPDRMNFGPAHFARHWSLPFVQCCNIDFKHQGAGLSQDTEQSQLAVAGGTHQPRMENPRIAI